MNIILLSILSTIIFSVLDNTLFLFLSLTVQDKLEKIEFIDSYTAELLTGGISAACSIFVATFIEEYLEKKYKMIDNPFIDFFGILIGTLLVIFVYILYKYIRNKIKKYLNNDTNIKLK